MDVMGCGYLSVMAPLFEICQKICDRDARCNSVEYAEHDAPGVAAARMLPAAEALWRKRVLQSQGCRQQIE